MGNTNECSSPCFWGWMGKRVLGLSLVVWLLFFAILPFTARGIGWTVNGLSGLWERSERMVAPAHEGARPHPRDRAREERDMWEPNPFGFAM